MAGTKQRSDPSNAKRVRPSGQEAIASVDKELADAGSIALPTRQIMGPDDGSVIIKSQNELAGVIQGPEEAEAIRRAMEDSYVEQVADDDQVLITGNVGYQQVVSPQYKDDDFGNRILDPGVVLRFEDGRYLADKADADVVKDALAGKRGKELQRQLQANQILVHDQKNAVLPPMPNWDLLPEDQVLTVARSAGFLSNTHQIKQAIAYEKARHEDRGGARDNVVAVLQSWLDSGGEVNRNPAEPGDRVTVAL